MRSCKKRLSSFRPFHHVGAKHCDGKGVSGKGRLTLARIDTIQNFHGLAIRTNKGVCKKMAKATRAILTHYSSTADEPKYIKIVLLAQIHGSVFREI